MQYLNEQLLLTFECVSSIGTSLNLETMVERFLRVFTRKTGALASLYWQYVSEEKGYVERCFLGKQALKPLFKRPDVQSSNDQISVQTEGKNTFLYVTIDRDSMVFLFYSDKKDLELLCSIVSSFHSKLENAVRACKNHHDLLEINQNLERRIEEEVAKNREKDKHILQQSRLAQMGEMISMIAHQWRQPLGSISAVAASIRLKVSLNRLDTSSEEAQEQSKAFLLDSMGKIESYVQFLTHTIDDFRNFFKPDKQKERVSLAQLVNRTLDIIGKALEINTIAIKVDVQSTREILTYASEVTQVILNVLKNAEDVIKERHIKYPHIFIHIEEQEEWHVLSIEDNAGGIPPHILPYIFEPYFSTKSEKNGSGLGLYMSKTIIEEHCGGMIYAENTPIGARFIIKLKEE
ncbi:sensor histidine kinase [Sulfurospirillum cavolei]|uniref:sensor histidine kinase n=1 Tax=Sulfurospirillum cavolei TaxID=366522 RepID=UPI0007649C89|nr:HAMP domain-containing sensor histidine kinase [Sulfurospirillum cavolei]